MRAWGSRGGERSRTRGTRLSLLGRDHAQKTKRGTMVGRRARRALLAVVAARARRHHPRHRRPAGQRGRGRQDPAGARRLGLDERQDPLGRHEVRGRQAGPSRRSRARSRRQPGRAAGLRLGDRRGPDEEPEACTDTELALPIGPLDRENEPGGRLLPPPRARPDRATRWTRRSTTSAARANGYSILISDGEETCAKDPTPPRASSPARAWTCSSDRHRARGEQQGPQAAAVHRRRGRRQTTTMPTRATAATTTPTRATAATTTPTPPTGSPTRSASRPARAPAAPDHRHPGHRHPRTAPAPRSSRPGSTGTATRSRPGRATTRSPALRDRR